MTAADLAVTLRRLRSRLGITQERAAAATGICRPAVSAIEHGSRKVSAAELAAFAELYTTTADALLAGAASAGEDQTMAPQGEPVTAAGSPPEGGRWLELELLGHRQRTGYVTEVTVCGAAMLHIDLPAKLFGGEPDAWEEYAPSALYGLSPVREESVRRAWDGQQRAAEERARRDAEWQQRQDQRALTGGPAPDGDDGAWGWGDGDGPDGA
ncbi:MAG TPA: helix-turn-helix transcriptional regulator [Streptosporangiaceae bacterium]|nr:helix-turn-helix transcriptional regulator [Streptosporangiaceae bacterium]